MSKTNSKNSINDYNVFYNEYIKYVPNSKALKNIVDEFSKTDKFDQRISKRVIKLLNSIKENYDRFYRNLPDRYKIYYREFMIKRIKAISNDRTLCKFDVMTMNTYMSNNIKSVVKAFIKENIYPISNNDIKY